MTYIQITLLILLTFSSIYAVIVTLSPQKKSIPKTPDTVLNKKNYEKTRDKERDSLIILYVQELRFKEEYKEDAFFKMPSLLQTYYLVDAFHQDMNYDNFLEFIICSNKNWIYETIASLEKIGAIKTKKLLEKALEILKNHGETIESIQEKGGYTIHDIIVEPDEDRNNKLITELEELDVLFHKQNENLPELNLAYFDKHKEELWKELT